MSVLQKLLSLLILKSAPQDLPYSPQLLLQLVLAYILSGIIVLQTTLNPADVFSGLLFGLLIQYVFTYSVLRALDKRSRFIQTFCAILGISVLFNLLSWPVFSVLADESTQESMKSLMSLIFLLMISWEVLVKANIFRHALEVRMFSALALSFSLFFISIALSQLLFPGDGAS